MSRARESILIVEDDRAMAELVRTYLEHEGYRVDMADGTRPGRPAVGRYAAA